MAHGIFVRLLVALVLLPALGATLHSARLFQQDLLATDVETELGFWGRKDYHPRPATVERVERKLRRLLELAPGNPQYLALLANYSAWQGYWSEDFELSEQFNQQAVKTQYLALESRPAHRHSWAKMLQYSSRTGDGKPMREQALARVQALQPVSGPD